MDSPDFEGLLQSFDSKISDVCGKLALLKHYQEKNGEECLDLNNIIGNVFTIYISKQIAHLTSFLLGTVQYMILNVSHMLEQQEEHLISQVKRCEDIFTLVNAQSEYIEANLSAFQGSTFSFQNIITTTNYLPFQFLTNKKAKVLKKTITLEMESRQEILIYFTNLALISNQCHLCHLILIQNQ